MKSHVNFAIKPDIKIPYLSLAFDQLFQRKYFAPCKSGHVYCCLSPIHKVETFIHLSHTQRGNKVKGWST